MNKQDFARQLKAAVRCGDVDLVNELLKVPGYTTDRDFELVEYAKANRRSAVEIKNMSKSTSNVVDN